MKDNGDTRMQVSQALVSYVNIKELVDRGALLGAMLACAGVTNSQVNIIAQILNNSNSVSELALFELWFNYQLTRWNIRGHFIPRLKNKVRSDLELIKRNNYLPYLNYYASAIKYSYTVVENERRNKYRFCNYVDRINSVEEMLERLRGV